MPEQHTGGQLKKAFLDLSVKMKSPDFIVPEEGVYEKQAVIEDLNKSFERLKENSINANLTDLAEGLPLGAITQLKILHFVLYHTQRHVYQMKRICDALNKKKPAYHLLSWIYRSDYIVCMFEWEKFNPLFEVW